jgi:membrane protease YdiL (CAAX protease family)
MTNSFWHIIFWNSDGQRLRPLWRMVLQMLMLGGMLVVLLFAFAFINMFAHWQISDTGLFVISTLMELMAFIGSVALAMRYLDKRSFADLGFETVTDPGQKEPSRYLAYGFVLAGLLLGGVFLVMLQLGWLQLVASPSIIPYPVYMLYLGIFVVVGFQEEVLCRGYHLQTISRGWNVYVGVLGSSLIFAGMHSLNPGFNWMGFMGIFAAGLLLAFAAVHTGQLWFCIGLHIGWNFFEAVVFGFPTSGVTVPALLHIHVTGPALWTGGAFGPEAGLIILPALAIGAGLVWLLTK